ncbi:MAG: exopolysaccharide biosynthesis polyprenyl glycosylphosphotransferase [Solirubrobacterales bacterium]|nr:exopolysaccharide biosynthesis polyprenyl glycosylphosphotransferase [Solirubrobacterales bacterium]
MMPARVPQRIRKGLGGAVPLERAELPDDALARHPDPLPPTGRIVDYWLEGPGRTILYVSLDFALASLAVLLAQRGVGGQLAPVKAPAVVVALPVLTVALLALRGAYRRRLRILALDWLPGIPSAITIATMAVAMLDLLILGRVTHPGLWVRIWLLAGLLVFSGRLVLAFVQRRLRSRRVSPRPVLILGAGAVGRLVARRLKASPEYGMSPVGFIDDDPPMTDEGYEEGVPVLGTPDTIEDVLSSTAARGLIVSFCRCPDVRLSQLIRTCQERGVEVSVVPRMFETINNRLHYEALGGLPLLCFDAVDQRAWQFAVKHAFDRLLAASLLVVLAPLLAAVALAVRLTSRGPILFRQRRVGRDGNTFDLYKFRSMQWQGRTTNSHGEDFVASRLVERDVGPGGVDGQNRLTSIGGVLRKLSLDELPQLINVLKGDMSIVGPRPERPEFVELFGREIPRYHERHRVKSGITGWAQVHGLRGPTSLRDRIEWDNYYVANWSLGLDLKILVLTVIALFHGG